MNWDNAIQQTEANAYIPKNNNPSGGDSPFAKFDAGQHIIRPIGVGNYAEDIPFRHVMQHTMSRFVNGKMTYSYLLCWDWLFSTEANRKNIVKPLMQEKQQLTQQDFLAWREYGCPFCRAANSLRERKADKSLVANMFPKNSYMWNVIIRGNQALGSEERLLIWSPSQKNHQVIMETAKGAWKGGQGIDIFNPATGYDWNLTASPEPRRYTLALIPIPTPITIQHTPYDLTDVMLRNFKTYQETIDMLNVHYAEKFAQYGYRVPGDATYAVRTVDPMAEGIRQGAINNQLNVPRETPQPIAQFQQPVANYGNTSNAVKPTLAGIVGDPFSPEPKMQIPGKVVSGQPYVPEQPPFVPDTPKKTKPVVDDEDDFWSEMTNSSPHNIPEGGKIVDGYLEINGVKLF